MSIIAHHEILSVAGGFPPAVFPASLTDYVLWLDPADLALSNGNEVLSWQDKTSTYTAQSVSGRAFAYQDQTNFIHDQSLLRSNNADEYVEINSLPFGTNFTLSICVALDTLTVFGEAENFHIFRHAAGNIGIQVQADSNYVFYASINSSIQAITVTKEVPVQSFVMLTIRYDGANLEAFVDGRRFSSLSIAGNATIATDTLCVLRHPTAENPAFYGCPSAYIGDVWLWDRAVTNTELEELTAYTKDRYWAVPLNTSISNLGYSGHDIEVVGTTAHMLHTTDGVTWNYSTASTADPHTWVLQASDVLNYSGVISASRDVCAKLYSGTWYVLVGDRGPGTPDFAGGDIYLYTGASLSALAIANSGNPVLVGDNTPGSIQGSLRYPAMLSPTESPDGNWWVWMDYRTDSTPGLYGGIIRATGSTLTSLTLDGTATILPDGTSTLRWDSDDIVAPDVMQKNGKYYIVATGYNATYDAANFSPPIYSHWGQLWESDDAINWSEVNPYCYLDNRLIEGSPTEGRGGITTFYNVGPDTYIYRHIGLLDVMDVFGPLKLGV